MGKVYIRISMDRETLKEEASLIIFEGKMKEKLKFFTDVIGTRSCFDIFSFNDQVDMIIDDEGTFVSGNPVFSIPIERYGENFQIVGSFMLGKKIETDEGIETVGFDSREEAFECIEGLEFKITGFIRQ